MCSAGLLTASKLSRQVTEHRKHISASVMNLKHLLSIVNSRKFVINRGVRSTPVKNCIPSQKFLQLKAARFKGFN